MPPVQDAIIAITSRCNTRCTTCHVWKSNRRDLLKPDDMLKLPLELETICLTGGEPFIRDDLPDFVRKARQRCPEAVITIETDGGDSDRVVPMLRIIRQSVPDIRVAVSIDGPREVHNQLRGGDFYDSAIELITDLCEDGFSGLSIVMTISSHNARYLEQVANLADEKGIPLTVLPAQGVENHLQVTEDIIASDASMIPRASFRTVVRRNLVSWSRVRWRLARDLAFVYKYLQGRRRSFRCRAGSGFIFVHSDGQVYGCPVMDWRMGNLHTGSLNSIMLGESSDAVRQKAQQCRKGCWLYITASSWYRAHQLRSFVWIVLHKLAAHLVPWL